MIDVFNNPDNSPEEKDILWEIYQETNNLKKDINGIKKEIDELWTSYYYRKGRISGWWWRVEENRNYFEERLEWTPADIRDIAERKLTENPAYTNRIRGEYDLMKSRKKPYFYAYFCARQRADEEAKKDEIQWTKVLQKEVSQKSDEFDVSQKEVLKKSEEFNKLMREKYNENPKFTSKMKDIYDNMKWNSERGEKPSREAFFLAYKWYKRLREGGETNSDILTIVDYSQGDQNHGKLYMIDINNFQKVLQTKSVQWMWGWRTATGKKGFSNKEDSFQSSLWFCVVNDPTIKPSKKVWEHVVLTWLESGINDNMIYRSMYAHGWKKSQWCIVVPADDRQKFLNILIWRDPGQEVRKGGTYKGNKKSAIFSYAPSSEYLRKSSIV